MHPLCTLSALEEQLLNEWLTYGLWHNRYIHDKKYEYAMKRINKRSRMRAMRKGLPQNTHADNIINSCCYWTYPIGNFIIGLL